MQAGGYNQKCDTCRRGYRQEGKQAGGDTIRSGYKAGGYKQEGVQAGGGTSRRGYKQEMIQTGGVQKEVDSIKMGSNKKGIMLRITRDTHRMGYKQESKKECSN
ncbi:hypothetical protein DPMN_022293 [Dreissena polymorpha]|uniref:Uncharacterized protein n=1 Tax=Dreissena polymorpha TaxID=45954 RepID=A0A9D4S9Z5_DREPO|nr:hypothetical protein DPMN_022293 [Dreissena polymorpha]